MKNNIIIIFCILILMLLITQTFIISDKVDKTEKKVDHVTYLLDSNMIIPYDVWIIAINRTNAMWNGLVVTDSLVRLYLGDPPGKWINQFQSDSLLKEFQFHMSNYHSLNHLKKIPDMLKEKPVMSRKENYSEITD